MKRVDVSAGAWAESQVVLAARWDALDQVIENIGKTSPEVVETLEALNQEGLILVVVTHDMELGTRAHRRIRMDDGAIVGDQNDAEQRFPPHASASIYIMRRRVEG